jgi:glutaminyl-peptide cyclotransferase
VSDRPRSARRPLVAALTLALAAACGDTSRGGPTPDTTGATPPAGGTGTTPTPPTTPGGPATVRATVVRPLPHDPGAVTEGLFILDGKLYESTGIEGKSDFREVDLATGAVKRKRDLPAPYFGEGIIALNGLLYQLTWKQGKAFVYDLATFAPRDTLSYYGEGWGLTTDGESIVMSDGSARIRFLDPKTFAVRRTVDVRDGASPVSQLNELEWVDGELFANVWQSEQIARIDPKTGAITQWVDLTGLISPADRTGREDVLNGIAYDAATRKLYVTGKYYSRMYEIAVPPKP